MALVFDAVGDAVVASRRVGFFLPSFSDKIALVLKPIFFCCEFYYATATNEKKERTKQSFANVWQLLEIACGTRRVVKFAMVLLLS